MRSSDEFFGMSSHSDSKLWEQLADFLFELADEASSDSLAIGGFQVVDTELCTLISQNFYQNRIGGSIANLTESYQEASALVL